MLNTVTGQSSSTRAVPWHANALPTAYEAHNLLHSLSAVNHLMKRKPVKRMCSCHLQYDWLCWLEWGQDFHSICKTCWSGFCGSADGVVLVPRSRSWRSYGAWISCAWLFPTLTMHFFQGQNKCNARQNRGGLRCSSSPSRAVWGISFSSRPVFLTFLQLQSFGSSA